MRDIVKQREAKRRYYDKNIAIYLARNKRAKLRKATWLKELKSSPCMDCGQSFPFYVMDFDHREPEKKKWLVSRLIYHSWKRLKEEVEKCDLVCANCHRIRTYGM